MNYIKNSKKKKSCHFNIILTKGKKPETWSYILLE